MNFCAKNCRNHIKDFKDHFRRENSNDYDFHSQRWKMIFQFFFIWSGKIFFSNNSSLLTRFIMDYQNVSLTFSLEKKITYRFLVYNLAWPLFGGLNFHTLHNSQLFWKCFWLFWVWNFSSKNTHCGKINFLSYYLNVTDLCPLVLN